MTKKLILSVAALGLTCAALAGCNTDGNRRFNDTIVPSIVHGNGGQQDQPVTL
ncbi:MAG: hypothetical protein PW791_05515 [Neorhizobium sp.]|nr:hypothetical protein [Neorhizobium sp.]